MIKDTREIFVEAWKCWVDLFPTHFDAAHPEMDLECAGIPVPLFNCAFPKRNGRDEELPRLIGEFASILAPYGVPGLVMARTDRMEEPGELQPVVRMPGMVAGELTAAKFPVVNAEIRHVRGEKMAEEIARLNVVSHEMSEADIRPMTCATMWEAPNHGFIIYADGKAVASGSATYACKASYIGWMATLPEYRGRGYAEAILRFADEFMRREYGATESVLHATEMGRRIYERMGYQTVDEFAGYLCGTAE